MESLASLGIGGPWTIGLGAVNAAMALGMVVTMMAVVGRVAFTALPEDEAISFLRAAFPVYYLLLTIFSGIGAAALIWTHIPEAAIMSGVLLTALFARYWLTPIAHALDDRRRAGQDVMADMVRVQKRISLIVVAQIFVLIVVVVRLAIF